MAIGERIRYFRQLRNMTQKELGERMGFGDKGDVRIAQYETGNRTPRGEILDRFAECLDVAPEDLNVDVESNDGVMRTLFALEEKCGLKIKKIDGKTFFTIDSENGKDAAELEEMLNKWAEISEEKQNGDMSEDSYLNWKYCYPERKPGSEKVSPDELSDMVVERKENAVSKDE